MNFAIVAVVILSNLASRLDAMDVLWDDKESSKNYNCKGTVTDAVCCRDDLCKGHTQSSCTSPGKRSFLCRWDDKKAECVAYRDVQNNVCCQKAPSQGCADLARGMCPENWVVPEGCCDPAASTWNDTLTVTKEGHVCCDAPCDQMEKNNCLLTEHCGPTARSLGLRRPGNFGYSDYIAQQYLAHPFRLGNLLPAFNFDDKVEDDKSSYEVKEITVTDMMDMLITALEKDTDVIDYDKTLFKDPNYGKYFTFNKYPLFYNYVDPDVFLNKIYTMNALQGLRHPFLQNQGHPFVQPGFPVQHQPITHPGFAVQQQPMVNPGFPRPQQPFANQGFPVQQQQQQQRFEHQEFPVHQQTFGNPGYANHNTGYSNHYQNRFGNSAYQNRGSAQPFNINQNIAQQAVPEQTRSGQAQQVQDTQQ